MPMLEILRSDIILWLFSLASLSTKFIKIDYQNVILSNVYTVQCLGNEMLHFFIIKFVLSKIFLPKFPYLLVLK